VVHLRQLGFLDDASGQFAVILSIERPDNGVRVVKESGVRVEQRQKAERSIRGVYRSIRLINALIDEGLSWPR